RAAARRDLLLRGPALGRRGADAARREPLRLFASAARERGQRRPQSQLRELQRAAPGQRGIRAAPSASPADALAALAGERRPAPSMAREGRSEGVPGGGDGGTVSLPRRNVLWRRAADVEQRRGPRRAARASLGTRAGGLDRLSHRSRTGGPRRENLRR